MTKWSKIRTISYFWSAWTWLNTLAITISRNLLNMNRKWGLLLSASINSNYSLTRWVSFQSKVPIRKWNSIVLVRINISHPFLKSMKTGSSKSCKTDAKYPTSHYGTSTKRCLMNYSLTSSATMKPTWWTINLNSKSIQESIDWSSYEYTILLDSKYTAIHFADKCCSHYIDKLIIGMICCEIVEITVYWNLLLFCSEESE